jgi:hypothetical protein
VNHRELMQWILAALLGVGVLVLMRYGPGMPSAHADEGGSSPDSQVEFPAPCS